MPTKVSSTEKHLNLKSETKCLPLQKAVLLCKNPDRKTKFDFFDYLGESEMSAVNEVRRERRQSFY